MREQPFNANHGSAVLETHQISLEHTSRIIPIPVRVISIEKSVPETLLFGVPRFKVKLCTRLSFLPLAPCNARCDGFTCIRHGSPPFLDRDKCGLCCRPTTRFSLISRKMDTRGLRLEPSLLLLPQSVRSPIYSNIVAVVQVNRIRVPGRVGSGNLLAGWPYRSGGYYLHQDWLIWFHLVIIQGFA